MQDIRVDDDFFNHPKTVRFHRRTGDHGVTCLFRLWCYASKFFHKGILTGMNAKEIAKAVLWEGDPDEFIDALLTAGGTPNKPGFLDISFDSQSNTQYGLHNWRKRNPYAYFREERSETARMAADIGWERRRKKVKEQHLNAKGNTESNSKRNAPSPSPSPSPITSQYLFHFQRHLAPPLSPRMPTFPLLPLPVLRRWSVPQFQ